MKKTMITLLAMSTVLVADHKKESLPYERQVEAINVWKLNSATLNEIMEGKHPFTSIEFKKDDQLPLSLFLKGDFVELFEQTEIPLYVNVKQDIYFRRDGDSMLFSLNNTDWKPLLDFITGTASVGLSVDEGSVNVKLGAEAYERK